MPSCPKCGMYSSALTTHCPRCSTQLLFPIEALIKSLKGEFPNRLSQIGFQEAFSHDGLLYNASISPHQVKRGDVTSLKVYFQSCYVGPIEVHVRASHHSAIKNQAIAGVSAELAPLEVAELGIHIEVPLEDKTGRRQVDFNAGCKPFKGTKKIT